MVGRPLFADFPGRCQRAAQPHQPEAPRSGAYDSQIHLVGDSGLTEFSSPVTLNSAALPLPPPMTVVNPTSSASTLDREVSFAGRNRACTVLAATAAAAAAPVIGGIAPPWHYFSPPLLQLTGEQDLEIL